MNEELIEILKSKNCSEDFISDVLFYIDRYDLDIDPSNDQMIENLLDEVEEYLQEVDTFETSYGDEDDEDFEDEDEDNDEDFEEDFEDDPYRD